MTLIDMPNIYNNVSYSLIKISSPGWERHFDCLEDLANKLECHICGDCLNNYGSDLDSMLSSCCGCEFIVIDAVADVPITQEELLEIELRKKV